MTSALFTAAPTTEGLFVTIDGPNGSGKTSIAQAITRALAAANRPAHGTCQPSSSPIGTLARTSEATIRGRALACLVAADRHQQVANEILPALQGGAVVVCDRYVESSLVLQRIDGVETDFILAVNSGIRRPDLRVRLIADEHVLAGRLAMRRVSPERRFEAMENGSARELALYATADTLLTERYEMPSITLDTTSTDAGELASAVVGRIMQRLEARNEQTRQ